MYEAGFGSNRKTKSGNYYLLKIFKRLMKKVNIKDLSIYTMKYPTDLVEVDSYEPQFIIHNKRSI